MVIFLYASRWAKFRNRKSFAAIVNSPTIPTEIGINKMWSGLALYDAKIAEARKKGQLYVGVLASHCSHEFLVRVPPSTKRDIPKEQVAAG
jgi:hypothetical protein